LDADTATDASEAAACSVDLDNDEEDDSEDA